MFDVLIIGAGPAGSAAAISCLQRNLSVAIIERKTFPRHAPGETLHPGIEPLLAQLGVAEEVNDAGFIRHEGIYVDWNGKLEYQPYGSDSRGPWLGYQAWRPIFDEILLRRAKKEGAQIMQPCVARAPLIDNGRVCGVRTSDGDLSARFVLDATGARAWLAWRLHLVHRRWSPPLIAYYGYKRTDAKRTVDAPVLRREPAGWTWVAQVTPERQHWLNLRIHGSKVQQIKSGRAHAADVTWREYTEPAGPGYYLLGDAACVLDPLSSHGVLKAVMSGMLCAHLIRQTGHSRSQQYASRQYIDWVGRWFRVDVNRMKTFYA